MAYQAIARKFRPQTFEDVVGQEHLTRTIRNAICDNRLHHAYLFSGARGVGKTTMARLLAKALNCRKGPTVEPCGECPSCREISESGATLDVQEIDAASHTSIDNVREVIIGTVSISPARDRYRIFIIDEVHRLSKPAFDALLKTVEEPPPNVVFVLATTAVHEVPITILSRCQHFEFKQIPTEKIFERLKLIAEKEGIDAESEAVRMVARAAAGSMRDGQSALDQVISYAGKKITQADVAEVLGLVSEEALINFAEAIDRADVRELLRLVADLVHRGMELRNFCRELMGIFRDLLVLRVSGDAALLQAPDSSHAVLQEISKRFTEQELIRCFHVLTRVEQDVKFSDDQRFALEMGLAKLASVRNLEALESIAARLSQLEERTGSRTAGGTPRNAPYTARERALNRAAETRDSPGARPRASAPLPESPPEPPPEPPFEPEEFRGEVGASDAETGRDTGNVLGKIVRAVEAKGKILIGVALEKAHAARASGDEVVIQFPKAAESAMETLEAEASRRTLHEVCRELFGTRVSLRYETSTPSAAGPLAPGESQRNDPRERVRTNPAVQQLVKKFDGEITAVRPPAGAKG